MVVPGPQPLRCAITNLRASGLATPLAHRMLLRDQVCHWADQGIDFVQLREKQIDSGELLALSEIAMAAILNGARSSDRKGRTQLLINGRPDIAVAASADGVHLTSHPAELTPRQVRRLFRTAGLPDPLVSISCHTLHQVVAARAAGAGLVLFGPVFEKRVAGQVVVPGVGLPLLQEACAAAGTLPVLALGGVTVENSSLCGLAGAAGHAGIRLFAGL